MNANGRRSAKVGWRTALLLGAGVVLYGIAVARSDGAGLLIADGGLGGQLAIEEQAVQVTINNGIAVTEVNQVFRNLENRQVEALYTFPVPKGASVAGFSMWIAGKEVVGEVVEKQRARQIYESYKTVRRDPGLLEQTDFKTFEMRIFPIGPQAQQRVRICYYQELEYDDDWATYVYPLATAAKGAGTTSAGRFSFSLHATSPVPITSVESPSHGEALVVAKHSDSYVQASLETARADLNRDVVVAYHLSRPQTGLDLLTSHPAQEDGYLQLTLTAGQELAQAKSGMDYVFILDVSGSMEQDGKLSLSRKAAAAFLNSLAAEDRFEVITFNIAVKALFGRLSPAEPKAKTEATDMLGSLQAAGGTSLKPAVSAAYRYADSDRTLNVVILSDGLAEPGDRQALVEIIQSRPGKSRVFCVGLGNEVNRPLLEQLADEAGGLSAFISQQDDFGRQAKAFHRKLLRPAATNLKIGFVGGQVYDVVPGKLPNLYHGMPVRLYGRYKDQGPVKIVVEAEVEGKPTRQVMEALLPGAGAAVKPGGPAEPSNGNPEIERMWAWHRINDLLQQGQKSGKPEAGAAEIVRLGEGYSIATQYTSFIVLENDAEYQRWQIARRNALRIQRDRKGQEELQADLEKLRVKSATALGPGMAAPESAGTELAVSPPAAAPSNVMAAPAPARPNGSQGWDPHVGGGPIGPVGLVLVGGLAAAEWLRRRKGKPCDPTRKS